MPPGRIVPSRRPAGPWSCTRERVTGPCGDCRRVQAENAAADAPPPGLLLSVGAQGGYAVPRQLAGRIRRR